MWSTTRCRRFLAAAGLFGALLANAPVARAVLIDSYFDYSGVSMDWDASVTFEARFQPLHGMATERPYFAELGTLVSTTAQLFTNEPFLATYFCVDEICNNTIINRVDYNWAGQALWGRTINIGETIVVTPPPGTTPPIVPVLPLGYSAGLDSSGAVTTPAPTIPITATNSEILNGWTREIQNLYSLSGNLILNEEYTPFATSRYIDNAIQAARSAGVTDPLAIAQHGQLYAQQLRNTSDSTAGENLNLRDAEYAFYGNMSGRMLADGQTDFEALKGSPLGLLGYSAVKALAQFSPTAGQLWSAVFDGAPPGQTTPLSGAPLGGFSENGRAFMHGLREQSIDTLGACVDGSWAACGVDSAQEGGRTPSSPLLPGTTSVLESAAGTVESGSFLVQPTPGEMIYLDPAFADIYAFQVTGNLFASLELPSTDTQSISAATILLTDGEVERTFLIGNGFSFVDVLGHGVETFFLYGLEGWLLADLVAGFTFVTGDLAMVQTLTLVTAPIPEPETYALLLAGLGLLGFVARRRRGAVRGIAR